MTAREHWFEVLPGFELGTTGSKPVVLNHYTIRPIKLISNNILKILTINAEGGIRTHEAEAVELKSTPFDRSGTSAILLNNINYYILI